LGAVILDESRKYNGVKVTVPLSHAMVNNEPCSNLRAKVICNGCASPIESALTVGIVDMLVTLGGST
jgi:hypothetical protein